MATAARPTRMQALWTMARENLDVTVVIYANRSYAILNIELQRVGAGRRGAEGAVDARPAQSRDQLGADRQRPRRRGQPRHHRGGIRRPIRLRDGAARPAADRSDDLRERAMSTEIVTALRAIVGEAGVLDPAELAKRSAGTYRFDTLRARRWCGRPRPRRSPR